MNKILATLAFGASIAATQAAAQAGPGGGGQQDMTRQQAQARADMLFQRLDLNHDGVVTRAEAQQVASQMAQGDSGGGRAQRMIDRAFGQAQSLTEAQFEAQSLTRFDQQDSNHDGVVTAAERQQARAQMRPERG
jgi:Ca2+-binding EF-hand superfamily protein